MNVREIALQIMNDICANGAYANVALTRRLEGRTLSEQDRRFLTELVYGAAKTDRTLEWMIGRYAARPFDKIAPMIQALLKLGFYQLFFMDKVPPSAACNQSVELAKKYGHAGTVKFVNAVLRSAARNPEKADFAVLAKDRARYLAVKYYHPEWMIRRWLTRFGEAETERLCAFNNAAAPLSLRANTLKTDRDRLLAVLAAEGAQCRASEWTPEGVVCSSHHGMASFASLREGLCQAQDESSMLAAHVLGARPGEFVIDACAAPGGKTTHIAALMENRGKVLATDIYEHKLEKIRENAARLGASIVEEKLLDAARIGALYAGQADRALVDAPCSGLGVLRRRSDARWRKEAALLAELPRLQLALLSSVARAVRPGGVLVYSTCTIETEENEAVVKAFLEKEPEFTLEPAGAFLPSAAAIRERHGAEDMVRLLPQQDGVDGFFIARLRRGERS